MEKGNTRIFLFYGKREKGKWERFYGEFGNRNGSPECHLTWCFTVPHTFSALFFFFVVFYVNSFLPWALYHIK